MKKKDVLSYIYDFISLYFEKENINNIKQIILFGSVAIDEFDEESDIDLFIDTKQHKRNIEKTVQSALNSFHVKVERVWEPKGISLPIKVIIGDLEGKQWKELKQELIAHGIVLYGGLKEIPEKLDPFYLIEYSITKLERKNKMKFLRKLFGYESVKDSKKYKHKGLIQTIRGYRIGINTLLIPPQNVKELKELFANLKIQYKLRHVWARKD